MKSWMDEIENIILPSMILSSYHGGRAIVPPSRTMDVPLR